MILLKTLALYKPFTYLLTYLLFLICSVLSLVFPYFFVSAPCTRLNWPYRQLLSACKYIVSYREPPPYVTFVRVRHCVWLHDSRLYRDDKWRPVVPTPRCVAGLVCFHSFVAGSLMWVERRRRVVRGTWIGLYTMLTRRFVLWYTPCVVSTAGWGVRHRPSSAWSLSARQPKRFRPGLSVHLGYVTSSFESSFSTRSSAVAERPSDAFCHLKSCQLLITVRKRLTIGEWPWRSLKVIGKGAVGLAIYYFPVRYLWKL